MLENITEFSLFYVKHPVRIELKLLHFKNTLASALESIPKEQLLHMYNILGQDITKVGVFIEEIKLDIKELNAIEIRDYTQSNHFY